MTNFSDYRAHIGVGVEKFYKGTLFQGEQMMVGINCLEPGQIQSIHDHSDQDKVYFVMEGTGHFTVGDKHHEAGQGEVVWAAAGVPHGVENNARERLVVLVCMAPPPVK